MSTLKEDFSNLMSNQMKIISDNGHVIVIDGEITYSTDPTLRTFVEGIISICQDQEIWAIENILANSFPIVEGYKPPTFIDDRIY